MSQHLVTDLVDSDGADLSDVPYHRLIQSTPNITTKEQRIFYTAFVFGIILVQPRIQKYVDLKYTQIY